MKDEKLNTEDTANSDLGVVSISASSVDCPECKKKGCGFCNGTGLIYFYLSPDAYDHIEISRAKWRISQRN
jgi:hypothetical protein